MNRPIPSLTHVIIPAMGRLLGVDYGTKRVGLAVSTLDQAIASPLANYTRQNESLDTRHFITIVSEYQIQALVVGLPLHVNGDEGRKAKESRAYGKWLSGISQLPVTYWDERYTSMVADEYLLGAQLSRDQRKKRLDMVAAQIMLQSYLDHRQQQG